jgi:hypothetical protein
MAKLNDMQRAKALADDVAAHKERPVKRMLTSFPLATFSCTLRGPTSST